MSAVDVSREVAIIGMTAATRDALEARNAAANAIAEYVTDSIFEHECGDNALEVTPALERLLDEWRVAAIRLDCAADHAYTPVNL